MRRSRLLASVLATGNLRYQPTITPTLTPISFVDGGMENWTAATNLTSWGEVLAGTSTVNREGTEKRTGNYAARFDVDATDGYAAISQSIPTSVGWIRLEFYGKTNTPGKYFGVQTGLVTTGNSAPQTTEWQRNVFSVWSTGPGDQIVIKRGSAASASLYIDDISLYTVPLASCLATPRTIGDYAVIRQKLRVVAGNPIGLAIKIDSITNPQNGIFAYVDGTNIRMDKLVNGVRTNIFSAPITWANDDELQIKQNGNDYWVTVNGAVLGSNSMYTVSDATIINNTIAAQFSTYEGNQFTSPLVVLSGATQRITILGDSIAAAAPSYVNMVALNWNGGQNQFVNRAVGGASIITDADGDLDMAGQVLAAESDNATLVLVALGTNDTITTDAIRAEYEANLLALKTSNPNARICCIGILDKTNMSGVAINNGHIQTACTNAGVEYHDPAGVVNTATMLSDAVHLNALGNRTVYNWILTWL